MMQYIYDEESQQMIYQYVEEEEVVDIESTINTEEGKAWFREQKQLTEELGEEYWCKWLTDLANYKFPEEPTNE